MVHVYLILVCYCISLYLNAEEQVMWVKSYFAAAEGWACTLCLELMYQTYCRGSSLTSWWMRQVWDKFSLWSVWFCFSFKMCVIYLNIKKKKKSELAKFWCKYQKKMQSVVRNISLCCLSALYFLLKIPMPQLLWTVWKLAICSVLCFGM